jgi:hypothetical protein
LKKRVLNILLPAILMQLMILIVLLFSGCENYTPCKELNSLFVKNDLDIEFKVLQNREHKYGLTTLTDNLDDKEYLLIDVENNFSVSSNRVSVTPGKVYKLSIMIKNESADPLVLYSFWKDSITESRYFTLAGENGNPPISETQNINKDWVSYEETFQTQENEKFIMIRIYSNQGVFNIKDISIEEI